MSRIQKVFSDKCKRHKALVAYVTAGYPDISATMKVIPFLEEHGCDIVEIGIPFSDPQADGVTIQNASHTALCNGVTPALCFDMVKELRRSVSLPIVLMSYLNPVVRRGFDHFAGTAQKCGVDGLIIPDLPVDEGDSYSQIAEKCGLDLIYLLAPTSTDERIKMAADRSRGFIYLVSVAGITGTRQQSPAHLSEFTSRARMATDTPLCVGFGVSTPEQAGYIAEFSDGVIIGSRIVQLMAEDPGLASLGTFIREVRKALDEE